MVITQNSKKVRKSLCQDPEAAPTEEDLEAVHTAAEAHATVLVAARGADLAQARVQAPACRTICLGARIIEAAEGV